MEHFEVKENGGIKYFTVMRPTHVFIKITELQVSTIVSLNLRLLIY